MMEVIVGMPGTSWRGDEQYFVVSAIHPKTGIRPVGFRPTIANGNSLVAVQLSISQFVL